MHMQLSFVIRASVFLYLSALLVACNSDSHAKQNSPQATATPPWEMLKQTDKNHYSVSFNCQQTPFVGDFQSCHIMLKQGDTAVSDARIAIDGGMKTHGHGLPTAPQISVTETPGKYAIKGLKFSMPGEWAVGFKILSNSVSDQAVFAFSI